MSRVFDGIKVVDFGWIGVGPITAREALIRSRNVPALTLASQLSTPSFYQFLRSAGISRMAEVAWAILEPRGKISFIQRSDAGGDEPPPAPKGEEDDSVA